VDENAGTIAATLQRVDGRLGTVTDDGFTADRTAQAGLDYSLPRRRHLA